MMDPRFVCWELAPRDLARIFRRLSIFSMFLEVKRHPRNNNFKKNTQKKDTKQIRQYIRLTLSYWVDNSSDINNRNKFDCAVQ